jgi:hypothetical protein
VRGAGRRRHPRDVLADEKGCAGTLHGGVSGRRVLASPPYGPNPAGARSSDITHRAARVD